MDKNKMVLVKWRSAKRPTRFDFGEVTHLPTVQAKGEPKRVQGPVMVRLISRGYPQARPNEFGGRWLRMEAADLLPQKREPLGVPDDALADFIEANEELLSELA